MPHVQIRNVPPAVHRKLKVRAAEAGTSLSDYLLAEVTELADLPTTEELVARIRSRSSISTKESSAEVVRRLRNRA